MQQRSEYTICGFSRSLPPLHIGSGMPKLVTILGTTNPVQARLDETRKAQVAHKFGASMIADVSTEGEIADLHKSVMDAVPLPLSTVPLYELRRRALDRQLWPAGITRAFILDVIEEQAARGVGCMTLHPTMTQRLSAQVARRAGTIKLQARGGGVVYEYIQATGQENPLLEYFDEILAIFKTYGVALSLGSSPMAVLSFAHHCVTALTRP